MTRAVLSLGSNLGDSRGELARAVKSLGPVVRAASAIYRTQPWGGVEQPDFLNQTVIVEDAAVDASGWLQVCRGLERDADRRRGQRWGPRTLDADVIAVYTEGRPVISADPELTLPHPRAHLRAFVLVPWLDLDPLAVLPAHGSVAALVAGLAAADRAGVERLAAS